MPVPPLLRNPGASTWHRTLMFAMVLATGTSLVLVGHQSVAGVSAFVAPFLVAFERSDRHLRSTASELPRGE